MPERAVDEHEVAGGEPGDHAVVEPREPGDVGDDAAGRAVAEDEAARLELGVRAEIARRVAARRRTARPRGSSRRAAAARPVRASATRRRSSAPASAGRDTRPSARARRPRRRRRAAASPTRACSSRPAVWSISASVSSTPAIGGARTPSTGGASSVSSCSTQVRRGVDEEPRPVVAADRERRLRARTRALTRARGLAHLAVAVPLRKASAGGRAENANAHVASSAAEATSRFRRLPMEHVRRDLGTQLDDLELGLDPRHSCLLSECVTVYR